MWRHCHACAGRIAPGDGPSLWWSPGDAPRHAFHLACWLAQARPAQAGTAAGPEQSPLSMGSMQARAA